MRTLFSLAALAAACFITGTAGAEVITYQFTATVSAGNVFYPDGSDDPDVAQMGDLQVVAGNTVTGRFSYDTAMPKWFAPRPNLQMYLGGQGALSLQVVQNGWRFDSSAADRPQAGVSTDGGMYRDGSDHFSFTSHTHDGDHLPPYVAGLLFYDKDGTAFDTTAMPAALDLRMFEQATLDVQYYGPAFQSQFYAQLTSLERVAAVPEPANAAMMLAGLALLSGVCRLRSHR